MQCPACGHVNADGSVFCAKCGTALGASSSVAVRPEAQVDTEAWETILGPKNRDYYLRQFAYPPGAEQIRVWHWPALFVTFYWLLSRKMYGWAVVYFFAPYIVGIALAVAIAFVGSDGYAANFLNIAYVAAFLIGPPMLANRLYYRHCVAVMEKTAKRPDMTRERYLGYLESKGGTSGWVFVVVSILVLVFLIGILAAIALPAYQDYTRRAKVAEAIRNVEPITRQLATRYERTGTLPASLQGLGPLPPSPHVRSIVLDPSNGAVRLVTTVEHRGDFVTLEFVPRIARDDGRVRWTCRPVSGPPPAFPLSCRGASN